MSEHNTGGEEAANFQTSKKHESDYEQQEKITRNFFLLDRGLDELRQIPRRVQSGFIQPSFENSFIATQGNALLSAVPSEVTKLDLGSVSVTRRPDLVEKIPENQRKTWGVSQLDEYAASLATSIGREYTPKFPTHQGK